MKETNLILFMKVTWLGLLTVFVQTASAMIGGSPARMAGVIHYVIPYGSCTGALIAPNLILTAAHCIGDVDDKGIFRRYSKRGQTIWVYGANGSDYARGRTRFLTTVAAVAVHPTWVHGLRDFGAEAPDRLGIFDVGLIKLRDGIDLPTASLAPLLIANGGGRLQTTGAGCQKRDREDRDGYLKTANVGIRDLTSSRILVGTSDRGTRRRAGMCKGDSGGPALMGGQIVGVNSVLKDTPRVGSTNVIRGYVARVDQPQVREWIQAALARSSSQPSVLPSVFNTEPQSVIEALGPYLGTVTSPAVLVPKMRQEPTLRCRSDATLRDLSERITRSPKSASITELLRETAICRTAASR